MVVTPSTVNIGESESTYLENMTSRVTHLMEGDTVGLPVGFA